MDTSTQPSRHQASGAPARSPAPQLEGRRNALENRPSFALPRHVAPIQRRPYPHRFWGMCAGLLFAGGAAVLLLGVSHKMFAESGHQPAAAMVTPWPPAPSMQRVQAPKDAMVGPTLLLSADQAIGEHHIFWLQQPRRLVVDLMNVNAAMVAPVVMPKNTLVHRVRHARHDDRVRFVVDVTQEAHDHVAANVEGASLTLTLFAHEQSP